MRSFRHSHFWTYPGLSTFTSASKYPPGKMIMALTSHPKVKLPLSLPAGCQVKTPETRITRYNQAVNHNQGENPLTKHHPESGALLPTTIQNLENPKNGTLIDPCLVKPLRKCRKIAFRCFVTLRSQNDV